MKILVTGDSIEDSYIFGRINRVSPEDPTIPVVDYEKEESRLGGCLNTAANIKSLSNYDVHVSTILNSVCTELLSKRNINHSKSYHLNNLEGIRKTRIINSKTNKQLIRLDNKKMFDSEILEEYHSLLNWVDFSEFDAVIVSDYNKGVVNKKIIDKLENYNGFIFVDTKNPDFLKWKKLSDRIIFKLNRKEWSKVNWSGIDNFTVVVTDGKSGAYLWQNNDFVQDFPTEIVKNPEVTGAGDVFISALAVDYIKHQNLHDAIRFANKAANKSVRFFGTNEVVL